MLIIKVCTTLTYNARPYIVKVIQEKIVTKYRGFASSTLLYLSAFQCNIFQWENSLSIVKRLKLIVFLCKNFKPKGSTICHRVVINNERKYYID